VIALQNNMVEVVVYKSGVSKTCPRHRLFRDAATLSFRGRKQDGRAGGWCGILIEFTEKGGFHRREPQRFFSDNFKFSVLFVTLCSCFFRRLIINRSNFLSLYTILSDTVAVLG